MKSLTFNDLREANYPMATSAAYMKRGASGTCKSVRLAGYSRSRSFSHINHIGTENENGFRYYCI